MKPPNNASMTVWKSTGKRFKALGYLQSHPQSLPPLRWWIPCWWCGVYGRRSEVLWQPPLQSSSLTWQTFLFCQCVHMSANSSFWWVRNTTQCMEFTAPRSESWNRDASLCRTAHKKTVPVIPFCYIWKNRERPLLQCQSWQQWPLVCNSHMSHCCNVPNKINTYSSCLYFGSI